ncbi:MarR family transcriptional regulator [uncultured Vagococcus sp.]|uniref:MarR family winged helix-turn-helix transcriptional regulator n=1 Tax=uncultured Vagococcus sp. TaxID=189676 RepID=UPI0028D58A10|nr:MarR family transcriptional regulator [uncultured Vagococcus sp.]
MTQIKIGKAIKALSNEINRYVSSHINSDNTEQYTMIQFLFMDYIGRFSATTSVFQRDLESEFNIRRSTATGILQVLEKNKLIDRQTSKQDARLKEIILTTEGQAVFKDRRRELDTIDKHLIEGVSLHDLKTFYAVMDQIYLNIGCREEKTTKGVMNSD